MGDGTSDNHTANNVIRSGHNKMHPQAARVTKLRIVKHVRKHDCAHLHSHVQVAVVLEARK